ncbi:MAG: hypothetical protein ACHQAV_06985 [Solirubrobacterales bacterium]
MRRATLLLILAGSGGLLLACGKSAPRAPSGHSAGAGSSGVTTRAATRQRALTFARAVNLTATDVPGFSVSSQHERGTAEERQLEHQMLRCAGNLSAGKGLAEVSSQDYALKRGILDLGVSSEVGVAQTSALATRELATIRSAHVRGCFSHYLDLLFKSKQFNGAIVSPVSIASGTPPAPGTAGGFGWRVTATFTVQRIRVPLYLDILGFVYGPARVTLFSSGVLRPFPAAVQQGLFSLLLSRAKAHRL